LPCVLIPVDGRKPGTVFIWILYLLVYVPAQVLPVYLMRVQVETVLSLQLSLLLGMLLLISANRLTVFPIALALPPLYFNLGFAIVYLFSTAVILSEYGVPSQLPSLGDVYDTRAELGAAFESTSTLATYLWGW